MEDFKLKSKRISHILSLVAPGTPLREGLDNILRAQTGGLIVVGFNEQVKSISDGGFTINGPYSPASIYELAKMDGAIVLNETGSKIILANTQLVPSYDIESLETGMRHRTAERVAKQTGNLVIAISQRRKVITLYQSNIKYTLNDIGVILTKANQAVQTLEKYKIAFKQRIHSLSLLEFEDSSTLGEVVGILHVLEMIMRIKSEIMGYVSELGIEGRLIRLQLIEILTDIEEESELLVKDYVSEKIQDPSTVIERLQESSIDGLIEDGVLIRMLGYPSNINIDEITLPRGYRILDKIPKLPALVIDNLVNEFKNLKGTYKASLQELDEVEGIGEVRARKIRDGLRRLQEQLYLNRHS